MSHTATKWLACLPAAALTNTEFRVLYHLCDCHSPARGCSTTQAALRAACGLSKGGLNNVLNRLEKKRLIRRIRMQNARTKRREPTRYVLPFEAGVAPTDPTDRSEV